MNDTPDITLPHISVIVPVYNDREHIELLLDSLSDQDYPKDLLEIIVVDNNSTDDSRQIAGRFRLHCFKKMRFKVHMLPATREFIMQKGRYLSLLILIASLTRSG